MYHHVAYFSQIRDGMIKEVGSIQGDGFIYPIISLLRFRIPKPDFTGGSFNIRFM